VTAGLGDSMLQHVGDVIAAEAAAAPDSLMPVAKAGQQQPFSVVDALQRAPAQAAAGMGGGVSVQRQRLQLPEAFGSDDDEAITRACNPPKPSEPSAADGAAAALEAAGIGHNLRMRSIGHMLCVKGAGVTNPLVAWGGGSGAQAPLSYTHSGATRCCMRCRCFVWHVVTHAPAAGSPLSVAVLQPHAVADGDEPQLHATLSKQERVMGGSWMINVSCAPLMLLPQQDVAAEAAR